MAPIYLVVSGVCWTGVYLWAIVLGFKQRTYGIPAVAIALNLAWETLASFYWPPTHPGDRLIFFFWFLFDCVIFAQALVYGLPVFRRLYAPGLSSLEKRFNTRALTYTAYALAWLLTGALTFAFVFYSGETWNPPTRYPGTYAAYTQNVLMSLLFLHWYLSTGNRDGQHTGIAVLKAVGSLSPAIAHYLVDTEDYYLLTQYVSCTLLDLAYIAALIFIPGGGGEPPAGAKTGRESAPATSGATVLAATVEAE